MLTVLSETVPQLLIGFQILQMAKPLTDNLFSTIQIMAPLLV